jgi:hypothetical protein
MLEIVGLGVIVFGILQIILFFKLWGMTNDVATIVSILKKETRKEPPKETVSSENPDASMTFQRFVEKEVEKNPSFEKYSPIDKELLYRQYRDKF